MEITCDLKGPAPMLDPRPGHASTQTGNSKGMTRTLEVPVDIPEASHPCPKNVPMFLEALLQNKTNRKPTCRIFSRVCGEVVAGSLLKSLDFNRGCCQNAHAQSGSQTHSTRPSNAMHFLLHIHWYSSLKVCCVPTQGGLPRLVLRFFSTGLPISPECCSVSFGPLPGTLLR